jgi:2-oxo-4-hydroxy-4-carboxy-5-ureidoimidazoline decarboxylase
MAKDNFNGATMTALHDFNQQRYEDALAHILPCVAIPAWAEALVRGRPYPAGMHCSMPPAH